MCSTEGGNHLPRGAWVLWLRKALVSGTYKSRHQPWHFLTRRNRTNTIACTGSCLGGRRHCKMTVLTAALLFSVLSWLQGAVEEGLGLSSAIITALIHSGMPRSVSISSRDGLCVQPLSRQCTSALPLCAHGHATSFFPM